MHLLNGASKVLFERLAIRKRQSV